MDVLELQGLDIVIEKLNKFTAKLPEHFETGLKKAGVYLQRESQKIVPVWTGNLKASAYTKVVKRRGFVGRMILGEFKAGGGQGIMTDVVVGYGSSAKYAIYVHQNLDKAHGTAFNVKHAAQIAAKMKVHKKGKNAGKTYWSRKEYYRPRGPDQQAKFLEVPARNKRAEMLEIIAKSVRDKIIVK